MTRAGKPVSAFVLFPCETAGPHHSLGDTKAFLDTNKTKLFQLVLYFSACS